MKDKSFTFMICFGLIPWILVIIIFPFLSGCNPVEVKIAEEVVEDVLAEELKGK